jgi:DNA-binding ferritin-like protein (Dps family)
MTAIIDKETLRHSLKEFAVNEPDFVDNLIKEIEEDWKEAKKKKLKQIIKEDFEEYAEVFKALA